METNNTSQEHTQNAAESSTINDQGITHEVVPSSHQIAPTAFWYEIKHSNVVENITIIATSAELAKEAIQKYFPNCTMIPKGKSEKIIQVNGEVVV